MATYNAKVTVDYYFDVEADDPKDAEQYAWYHFDEYSWTAEIYDIEIEEEVNYDDDEDDDDDTES
jgi:hypothetical protein